MAKRIPLNPRAADTAKIRLLSTRRTPLGVMGLVANPDWGMSEKVFQMASSGLDPEDIATLLGLPLVDIKVGGLFHTQYAKGRADANYKVSRNLFHAASGASRWATREEVQAATLWLKAKAGWREDDSGSTPAGGPNGPPVDDAGRRKQLARLLIFAGAIATRGKPLSDGLGPEPGPPNRRLPIRS